LSTFNLKALFIADFRRIFGSFDILNLSLVLVVLEAIFAVALSSIYAYNIRIPELPKLYMANSARIFAITITLFRLLGQVKLFRV